MQNGLLTNIYGPSTTEGKSAFVDWLKNVQMPDHVSWLLVGDFNLMRSLENRTKPGGNVTEMFMFNEAISALRLVELPLHGRQFTWTNKQDNPLLERVDWFFTSSSWTWSYPDSSVLPLVMETSDHVPCLVKAKTDVPKGNLFRFENYWMEHDNFMAIVQHGWSLPTHQTDKAKIVIAKFKNLRRVLKAWSAQISGLKKVMANVKLLLSFLDFLEEIRDLSLQEWNFREILANKLVSLLKQQRIYWKQRGTIK